MAQMRFSCTYQRTPGALSHLIVDYSVSQTAFTVNSITGYSNSPYSDYYAFAVSHTIGYPGGSANFNTTGGTVNINGCGFTTGGYRWDTGGAFTVWGAGTGRITITVNGGIGTYMTGAVFQSDSDVTLAAGPSNLGISLSSVSRTEFTITRSWSGNADTCQYSINNGSSWFAEGGTSGGVTSEFGTGRFTGATANTTYNVMFRMQYQGSAWVTSGALKVVTTHNAPSIGARTLGYTRAANSLGSTYTAALTYTVTYDNAAYSSRKIEYGTSTSYGSSVSNTKSISGLQPNRTYYYRITETDNGGNSTTSATATGSFTTPGIAPTISGVGATPNRTGATIAFTASFDTNASQSSYKIDYGTTANYGSTVNNTKTISGLNPNTTYQFRITVTDNFNRSVTATGSFTTGGNNPTASALNVSSVTRTSANLSITASYESGASNSATEYYYGTTSGSYTTSTGASMTGLTPNTTYYVQGRVRDNYNRWSGYVYNSFKTLGNAPTITSHGVQTYGQTTMTMKYTATYDTNDSLGSYKWEFGTTNGTYTKTVNNSNSITGLNANTTYYYRLTVVSAQDSSRTVTATGSFKTDYATQQVQSITPEEITETTIGVYVNVPNPTWLTNVTCWLYEENGTTLKATKTLTSGIKAANYFLFEDLEPGTSYVIKARITTYAQSASVGGYNSNIYTAETIETLDASPIAIIGTDGKIKKHKMYVMGKANIYDSLNLGWQNGYYAQGQIGDDISTLLTQSTDVNGGAACTITHIEILPNVPYTISNNDDVEIIIHGTNGMNQLTSIGRTISSGLSFTYIGTADTTRLWVSIVSSTNPMINYATAQYFDLSIHRTIEITQIPKENVIYMNGKIRYIDIIQAGNTVNKYSHIVQLEVYNSKNENVALGKPAELVFGQKMDYGDRITNGNLDSDDYADIFPKNDKNLETIVRVDLGEEYTDIEYVKLWRYYSDGRMYHDTRLLGRDGEKRLTWKFQSYKMTGEYVETEEGFVGRVRRQDIVHVPYIVSILQIPDNDTLTIDGTNIIIDGDWMAMIPPVLNSYISYRTDAILAANQGRLLKDEIGNLDDLETHMKKNLVAAINEIWRDYNGTDDYNNIIEAILNAPLTQ